MFVKFNNVLRLLPKLNFFSKHPRLSIGFWGLNIVLLLMSLILYFTKPELIISLFTKNNFDSLQPQNVSIIVSDRILDISNTPYTEKHKLDTKLTSLYVYMKSVINQPAHLKSGNFSPDYNIDIKILNELLARWQKGDTSLRHTPELINRLVSIRNRLQSAALNTPKQHATWYMRLSRFSSGYLEGLSSPLLLPYRAVVLFLSNNLTFRSVTDPAEWRREGAFFYLALLYSSFLSIYIFALFAHLCKTSLLYIPGVMALSYGILHFFMFLYQITKSMEEIFFI